MARDERITLPQVTRLGKITSYEELKPLLIEAETRGRLWVFQQSQNPGVLHKYPTDLDVYALHHEMFNPIYSWAGQPRREDRGARRQSPRKMAPGSP